MLFFCAWCLCGHPRRTWGSCSAWKRQKVKEVGAGQGGAQRLWLPHLLHRTKGPFPGDARVSLCHAAPGLAGAGHRAAPFSSCFLSSPCFLSMPPPRSHLLGPPATKTQLLSSGPPPLGSLPWFPPTALSIEGPPWVELGAGPSSSG